MIGKCKICKEQAEYEKFGKMCKRHYLQMLRHGKIISIERINKRVPKDAECSFCKSQKKVQWQKNRLLCIKHRTQWSRHGKLFNRTRSDKNEIVELRDYCKMYLYNMNGKEIAQTIFDKKHRGEIQKHKWGLDKDGYVVSFIKSKRILLHRFILNYFGKLDIDHKNHVRHDNRDLNLRICSRSDNLKNNQFAKGVSIKKKNSMKKYRAYITVDKKRIELGCFYTEQEAKAVRLEAEKKHFGEFAPIAAVKEYREIMGMNQNG